VTISTGIPQQTQSTLEVNDSMTIDEGTYLVLRSASGAFTCRYPPIPKRWNSVDRPHVALLLPDAGNIFSVFLSNPEDDESKTVTVTLSWLIIAATMGHGQKWLKPAILLLSRCSLMAMLLLS